MDYTLRYNSSKGLYISDDNRDGDKILLSSHYIMHERRREFELTEDNFRVFVWSNFGCAYYMQAIIYYNGRKLLDFNPQKIFVLNHRELSIFYVSSTMGIDKAWLAIFETIIKVYNDRDLYYLHNEPEFSLYYKRLLELASAQEVNVWGSWNINHRPTTWKEGLHSFSLFSDNLYLLLNEAEKDDDFSEKHGIDIMTLCKTFLVTLKKSYSELDYNNKTRGGITIEERLVRTFDKIHKYMEAKGESVAFLSTLIQKE
jgi:hypothetical protein